VIAASAHIFQQRNLKDFANGLLQQVVALLRLEHSMLLRLRGATAISGENDYEILAQIGDEDGTLLTPDVLAQLDAAKSNKISRVEGDTYIGYFPNSSGKASLLVLKGVEEISEIDTKLLEVFCSGVAIAFDNILLNQEITDTQAELILRLGDVVESRSNEAGNHVRRMSKCATCWRAKPACRKTKWPCCATPRRCTTSARSPRRTPCCSSPASSTRPSGKS
jgi:hypothetical protein